MTKKTERGFIWSLYPTVYCEIVICSLVKVWKKIVNAGISCWQHSNHFFKFVFFPPNVEGKTENDNFLCVYFWFWGLSIHQSFQSFKIQKLHKNHPSTSYNGCLGKLHVKLQSPYSWPNICCNTSKSFSNEYSQRYYFDWGVVGQCIMLLNNCSVNACSASVRQCAGFLRHQEATDRTPDF